MERNRSTETGQREGLPPDERVKVRGDGIDVDRVRSDVGVAEVSNRFGGVDVPAVLAGMLAALGTVVLLASLLGGLGVAGYQATDAPAQSLTWAGAIAGLVTLLVAFTLGGWVAGRMARYDGGLNGLLTAVAFLLLAALVSVLGAVLGNQADLFADVRLPQWFSRNAISAQTLITGLVALVVMLAAGWFGGRKGEKYHRSADDLLVSTREGGVNRSRSGGLSAGADASTRDGRTSR